MSSTCPAIRFADKPVAFRYGDYSAIIKRYLPADYLRDARNYRVAGTVYIETEWDPRDPVGEMAYVMELRRVTGYPSVAVAQAWLDREDAVAVLEQLAAFDFVRCVRQKPRANATPRDSAPGGTEDAAWRQGDAAALHERPGDDPERRDRCVRPPRQPAGQAR